MSVDAYESKTCEFCGCPETTEDQACQCDCDHDDLEGGECLNCGKDCTEDLAAASYDYAKGLRQESD